MRGLPVKDHDERGAKEKQKADMDERSNMEMWEKEKDIG